MYIAVMNWDAETNSVTKYATFETLAEAREHVAKFSEQYPNAFAKKYDGRPMYAVINPANLTVREVIPEDEPTEAEIRAEKKTQAMALMAEGKTAEALALMMELI